MNPADGLPTRRRDAEGRWHDLGPARCAACGCTYHFALDDPSIVWEPGRARGARCIDLWCRCHVDAVNGVRRS